MMIDTHNDWYIDDELLDILDEAIQGVKDDEEFHEGWDDVKELEKNIKDYEKQLESYRKHIKELHDNWIISEQNKNLLVFHLVKFAVSLYNI